MTNRIFLRQLSAQQAVERRYNEVLRRQGIDSEEIETYWGERGGVGRRRKGGQEDEEEDPIVGRLFPETVGNGVKIGIRGASGEVYDWQKYRTDFEAEEEEEGGTESQPNFNARIRR